MQPHPFLLSRLRVLAVALAVVSLGITSGCFLVAAGAAGAGTVAYVRGELESTLGNSYEQVTEASSRAITQLEFARISEARDAFSSVIIARTSDDKKIEIKVGKKGDQLSTVRIRIGLFGDEERSRAILDKIKANL